MTTINEDNNMIMKRFQEFPKKNEDAILDICGFPESMQFIDAQPFYEGNEKYAFLFTEEGGEFDIVWIVKPDEFSMKVYQSYLYKSHLVELIIDKHIAVFVKEVQSYKFYGVYKLEKPFSNGNGLEMAVNVDTPLKFRFEKNNLEIE